MAILRCDTGGCDGEMFTAQITVGPSGEITEEIKDIPGEYFECVSCHQRAKWVDNEH